MLWGKTILNLEFYIPSQTVTHWADTLVRSATYLTRTSGPSLPSSFHGSPGIMATWNSGKRSSKSNEVQVYRSDLLTLSRGSQESKEINWDTVIEEWGSRSYHPWKVRRSRWQRLETAAVEAGCWIHGTKRPAFSRTEKREEDGEAFLFFGDIFREEFRVGLRSEGESKTQRNRFRIKETRARNGVPQNAVKNWAVDSLICAGVSWVVIEMCNGTARREQPWRKWWRSIRVRKTGFPGTLQAFQVCKNHRDLVPNRIYDKRGMKRKRDLNSMIPTKFLVVLIRALGLTDHGHTWSRQTSARQRGKFLMRPWAQVSKGEGWTEAVWIKAEEEAGPQRSVQAGRVHLESTGPWAKKGVPLNQVDASVPKTGSICSLDDSSHCLNSCWLWLSDR